MSDDTVLPRIDPGATSVMSDLVTEFLRILEPGGSGAETAASAAPSGMLEYGKGLGKYGANYAKASIPKVLRETVEASPPEMISARLWQMLPVARGETEVRADAAVTEAEAALEAVKKRVAALKVEVASRPASTPPPAMPSPPVPTTAKRGRAARNADAVMFDDADSAAAGATTPEERLAVAQADLQARESGLAAAKKGLDDLHGDPDFRAMALLDSPANNPERNAVTKALAQLEAMSATAPKQDRFKELAKLQRVLFDWNDRRARLGMPPAAEAVALGDLVQRCQQQAIGDIVANGGELPLPDGVDPTVAGTAKQQWQNIIDSSKATDWRPRDGNRISIPRAGSDECKVARSDPPKSLDPAETQRFQTEVLTDIALLMQTDAGRKLIDQLNNTDQHAVRIQPGVSQGCLPRGTSADRGGDKKEGMGSQAAIYAVLGSKDSDVPIKGKNGNVLTAPTAVILGHELIHGLHMTRGKNKHKVGPDKIPAKEQAKWLQGGMADLKEWDNMEEYYTIFKGKLSEQTLRAQFGMSAERYGHREAESANAVAGSFSAALAHDANIDALGGRDKVDQTIQALGFDPDQFIDAQKVHIVKARIKGPLPRGWPAAQLSVPQIAIIVAQQIDHARFQPLGWSPFDLDDAQLHIYVQHQAYEGRTPQGLAYRAKGGDAAFDSMKIFTQATMVRMPPPPAAREFAGPLNGVCTPAKMDVLNQAETVLNGFLKQGQVVMDADLTKRVAPRVKLSNRLAAVSTALSRADNNVANDFSEASVDMAARVDTDEKKLVGTMADAMKTVGGLLAQAKRGVTVQLEEAVTEARKAIQACRAAKAGILASSQSKRNRETLCGTFEKQCTDLQALIKATSDRASATLIAVRRAQGYTAADVETLTALLGSAYLTATVRDGIAKQVKDAAEWLRQHPQNQ